MKKCSLLLVMALVSIALSAQELKKDTTIRFNQKTIQIADSIGQVTVKVYDANQEPFAKVYEGVFSDGKSYEKWTVIEEIGIQLPFITKSKKKKEYSMEPHWAGLGWGFLNITNQNYTINNIDGVSLKSESSNEFYFNFAEKILPVIRNNFGITSGMGLNWKTYYLDTNQSFKETNGITGLVDAPAGVEFDYSRLRMLYLTIPLMLEWQPGFGNRQKFFVSAGVVGGVNTMASAKSRYKDGTTTRYIREKGLNAAPITLDYMAQIGYGSWNVYAKYSPFGIFQSQKGPDIRSVSVGATLNF
jgi:hypothetical protein